MHPFLTSRTCNRRYNAEPFTRDELKATYRAWRRDPVRRNRHRLVYVALCRLESTVRISVPMFFARDAVDALESHVAPYRRLLATYDIDADVAVCRFKRHARPMPNHAAEVFGDRP